MDSAGLMLTLALDWAHLGKVGLMMVFIIASVFLILTVLIQKPQGGGLAGAFGSGAGSGQTAFGAKTGDALTIATIIMFVFYLATAVGLTYVVKYNRGAAPTPTVSAPPEPAGTTPAEGTPAPTEGDPAKAAPTDAAPAQPAPAQPAPAQPAPVEPAPATPPATTPTPAPAPAPTPTP
jgi:protein translocase SecG subunit